MRKLFLLAGISMLSLLSANAQQIGSGALRIDDLNAPLHSGMYISSKVNEGYPDTQDPYKYLISINSSGNYNYQMQISGTYAENDRLFFRKIVEKNFVSKNTKWHEVATRGTNTFTGTQIINGDQTLNGNMRQAPGKLIELGYVGSGNYKLMVSTHADYGAYVDYTHGLLIRDKDRNNVMHFAKNGNIGIGKDYANHKLEVNGNIRAKGLILETFGWADFVFEPDYELPTLNEVSAHIQEHKHLPGIPSAIEVEENGINISDIQAKLLQKIEELTLYMIEENKSNQELKEYVKEQQKLIDDLQKKMNVLESK